MTDHCKVECRCTKAFYQVLRLTLFAQGFASPFYKKYFFKIHCQGVYTEGAQPSESEGGASRSGDVRS